MGKVESFEVLPLGLTYRTPRTISEVGVVHNSLDSDKREGRP